MKISREPTEFSALCLNCKWYSKDDNEDVAKIHAENKGHMVEVVTETTVVYDGRPTEEIT